MAKKKKRFDITTLLLFGVGIYLITRAEKKAPPVKVPELTTTYTTPGRTVPKPIGRLKRMQTYL